MRNHWAALDQGCSDRESRKRLTRLIDRLCGHDRGARESALAEVELAILLIRAGFAIRFLPESQSRTADLECSLEGEGVFVEVTAVIGEDASRSPGRSFPQQERQDDEKEAPALLIKRLVARISQKARQLADYREPVVLANVHLVERAGRQTVHPRVRMLVLNPAAGCPLAETQVEGLRGLL